MGVALSFLSAWRWSPTRRWHGRFTHDGTGGVQKFHAVPTPRIGGVALALAYGLVWPMLPEESAPTWALIGLAGGCPCSRGSART